MIELDHLQTYQFNLTTQGLLFVGSGKKIPKKEYIFNNRKNTVSFLDEHAFFDLLVKKDLVEMFENYCMQYGDDLYVFLYKTCHLTSEDVKPAILYEVSVGNALDSQHSLKEINALMRDENQRAYIPGSSLKGAIRTALLFEMIQNQKDERKHTLRSDKKATFPEEEYLHTLGLKGVKPNDAVNSIMRGIQVSDSEPISNQQLTLGTKTDSNPRGITHDINLCRECIKPGTCIRFRLTLDQSILKGAITDQSIMAALADFYAYQQQTYARKFTKPADVMSSGGKCLMTFGGGAGFFTKSLAYPYLGEDEGLMWTSNFLHQSFYKHHHDSDPRNFGISPHTMKYAKYQNKLYSFGTCEVSIQ